MPFSIKEDGQVQTLEIFLQKTLAEEDNTWLWVGLGSATVLAIGGTIGAVLLLEEPDPILLTSFPGESDRAP